MEQFTKNEIEMLATETIGQFQNQKWHSERLGRLKSAAMLDMIQLANLLKQHERNHCPQLSAHLKNEIRLMRLKICTEKQIYDNAAVNWGIVHEIDGLQEYVHLTGNLIRKTGLWVYQSGYVTCSPDALVRSSKLLNRFDGIVEIKCPFSLRSKSQIDSAEWGNYLPYLTHDGKLNKAHRFYHRVQAEIFGTRTNWCDFFIWTPWQCLLIRVMRDEKWIQTNVPLVEMTMEKYILPLLEVSERPKYQGRMLVPYDPNLFQEIYRRN